MTQHQASRTLLKSPPELWAECSDAQSLARHLDDSFGEIRITRLEPEQTVAWEGESVSGTVRLEPSGWGTKVTLTAGAVRSGADAASHDAPPQAPELVVAAPREQVEVVPPKQVQAALPKQAQAAPSEQAQAAPREPVQAPPPEPVQAAPPRPTRGRFVSRLWQFLGGPAESPPPSRQPAPRPEPKLPAPRPEPVPEFIATSRLPDPSPGPTATPPAPDPSSGPTAAQRDFRQTDTALNAALESLGKAHHRPFSRA